MAWIVIDQLVGATDVATPEPLDAEAVDDERGVAELPPEQAVSAVSSATTRRNIIVSPVGQRPLAQDGRFDGQTQARTRVANGSFVRSHRARGERFWLTRFGFAFGRGW